MVKETSLLDRVQRSRVTLRSLTLPVCTMHADRDDGNLHSIVIPAEAGIHSYSKDLFRSYYQFRGIDNSENQLLEIFDWKS